MSNLFAEGYKEGMDISQQLSRAEALKAKSTLAIDQAEQNLAQSKTQQDISKQELEQLKQKTKELERAVTLRDSDEAINSYLKSDRGDSRKLNRYFQTNPYAKDFIPGYVEAVSLSPDYESVDKTAIDTALVKQDIDPANYANMSDTEKQDALFDSVVVTRKKQDGTTEKSVHNISDLMNMTGWYERAEQKDLDLAIQKQSKLNALMSPAQKAEQKVETLDAYSQAIQKAQAEGKPRLVKALKQELGIKDPTPAEQKVAFELEQSKLEDSAKSYATQDIKAFQEELKNKNAKEEVTLSNGSKITLYEIADKVQGNKKVSTNLENELSGKRNVIQGTQSIMEKVSKLDNWNMGTKVASTFEKLFGDWTTNLSGDVNKNTQVGNKTIEDMKSQVSDITDEETRQYVEAYVFPVIADYIKAMSGAAVSEGERTAYVNNMTAGWFADKTALTRSLKGFGDSVTSSYENIVDGLRTQYPRTYLDFKKEPVEQIVQVPEQYKDVTNYSDLKQQYMVKYPNATEEDFNRAIDKVRASK